jgi:hypothetical protein
MGQVADTRYRTYPWDEPQGTRGAYVAPFGSGEYIECHDALDTVTAPENEIAARVCPLPQVQLAPPRFGYARTQPGIRETLSVARLYPDQSRSLSGTEAGYTGSPRNALSTGANSFG